MMLGDFLERNGNCSIPHIFQFTIRYDITTLLIQKTSLGKPETNSLYNHEECGLVSVTPFSSKKIRRFGGTSHLHLQGRRVRNAINQEKQAEGPAYFSTLNMEAVCPSDTSVSLLTSWSYNPEARTAVKT
jgi:hypothetical protein